MSVTKEQVVQFLENMTLLEASELVKELETKFGVSAAAPVAFAAINVFSAGFYDFRTRLTQTYFGILLWSARKYLADQLTLGCVAGSYVYIVTL